MSRLHKKRWRAIGSSILLTGKQGSLRLDCKKSFLRPKSAALSGKHLLGKDPREFANNCAVKRSSVRASLEAGRWGQGFLPQKIAKANRSPFIS